MKNKKILIIITLIISAFVFIKINAKANDYHYIFDYQNKNINTFISNLSYNEFEEIKDLIIQSDTFGVFSDYDFHMISLFHDGNDLRFNVLASNEPIIPIGISNWSEPPRFDITSGPFVNNNFKQYSGTLFEYDGVWEFKRNMFGGNPSNFAGGNGYFFNYTFEQIYNSFEQFKLIVSSSLFPSSYDRNYKIISRYGFEFDVNNTSFVNNEYYFPSFFLSSTIYFASPLPPPTTERLYFSTEIESVAFYWRDYSNFPCENCSLPLPFTFNGNFAHFRFKLDDFNKIDVENDIFYLDNFLYSPPNTIKNITNRDMSFYGIPNFSDPITESLLFSSDMFYSPYFRKIVGVGEENMENINNAYYIDYEHDLVGYILFDKYGRIITTDTGDFNIIIIDPEGTPKEIDLEETNDVVVDNLFNFDINTFGLSQILTKPLIFLNSISSQTCETLHIPLPFLNNKFINLPCMTTIYENNFGELFVLFQFITNGIISYYVIVNLFKSVKDIKDPKNDSIEVMEL